MCNKGPCISRLRSSWGGLVLNPQAIDLYLTPIQWHYESQSLIILISQGLVGTMLKIEGGNVERPYNLNEVCATSVYVVGANISTPYSLERVVCGRFVSRTSTWAQGGSEGSIGIYAKNKWQSSDFLIASEIIG